ncbi:MAG: hypothetical protein ACR2PH_11185, partial [Desulfobulbia bacterium]
GRWLTGLSGSISSGANSLDTLGTGVTRNQYSIDLRTGVFVKDRFLVGGLITVSRVNSEEFSKNTAETLFVGPLFSWYLTKGETGSLFISATAGYVKFRDESSYVLGGNQFSSLIDGNGGGGLLRFGYSYVLHDRVAFDLGLNYSQSWIRGDITEQPGNTTRREDFIVGDLSFSFGFNVILDKFFF